MPRKKANAEVLERFDPDAEDGDHEIDGDIRYELALDESRLPADRHYVWVAQSNDPKMDCVKEYKHRGFRVINYDPDGPVQMKSGLRPDSGAVMTYRDHVLMECDKAANDKRESRERAFNRKVRAQMISKNNRPVYLQNPDR